MEPALLLLFRVAVRLLSVRQVVSRLGVVAAPAFPVWLQQAHLNAGRQNHPFFFSKKVPCEAIISILATDYTDHTDKELLTGVIGAICGVATGLVGFLSLTCPGLIWPSLHASESAATTAGS